MARPFVICLAALVAGCATNGSYVDEGIHDPGGTLATEIVSVPLEYKGRVFSVNVLQQYGDSELKDTVPASLIGAGIPVDDDGEPLRYIVSRFLNGVLLRIEFMHAYTVRFFRKFDGDYVASGPRTRQSGK